MDENCTHNVRCTNAVACGQRTRPCGHRSSDAYPCCLGAGTLRVLGDAATDPSYFDRQRTALRTAHRNAVSLSRYIRAQHGADPRVAALVLDVAAGYRRDLAELKATCF